jgi:hypothetical protein
MDQEGLYYPKMSWLQHCRLRSSAWDGAETEGDAVVFRTLPSTGDLVPDDTPPPWSFHLGLTENFGSAVASVISSGFRLQFPSIAKEASVSCMILQQGVLVGHSNFGLSPTIFSPEFEVAEEDGCQWAVIGDKTVLLYVRHEPEQTMFCLVVCRGGRDEAYARAEGAIALDPVAYGNQCFARRAPIYAGLENIHDNSLLVRGVEEMVFHLEGSHGDGSHWWSAADLPDRRVIDPNQAVPLALAWKEIDADVAVDIMVSTVGASEDLYQDRSDAGQRTPCAWPCLIAAVEIACTGEDTDTSLINQLLPTLHGYLERAIRYFDAEENGMVTWKTAEESLIPDAYDANLGSAGLCAMLLAELDSFSRLTELAGRETSTDMSTLAAAQDRFQKALVITFWDSDRRVFSDRYIGGDPVARLTLSGLMAIWNRSIDPTHREAVMRWIQDPRYFEGPDGIPLWQEWENDPVPPPVPPVHQIFVLEALRRHDLQETVTVFESRIVGAMLRHTSLSHLLPVDLHTGEPADLQISEPHWYDRPVMAGCLLVLTAPNVYRRQASEISPLMRTLDKNRYLVVGSVLAAFGIVIVALSMVLTSIGQREGREASPTELIRYLIVQNKFDEALAHLEKHAEQNPDSSFEFLRANILFRKGRYPEAEPIYRSLIQSGIEAQKSTLNLALSLFWQGNFTESQFTYEAFTDQFEEASPRMQLIAQIAAEYLQQNKTSLSLELMEDQYTEE